MAASVTPPALRPSTLITALGLALGPAVALGLGRFAYALLLPAMRRDLGWSYAQSGAVNTANAIGYLLGALVAAPLAARWGDRRTFLSGLVVTTLALLGSAAVSGVAPLLALRAVAGCAGGIAFVAGAGLAAQTDTGSRSALALSIYAAGGGLGIIASGGSIPPLLALGGATAWRLGWLGLGVLAALAVVGAASAARQVIASPHAAMARSSGQELTWLLPTLIAYGLFGAGYIVYMTFAVTFLQDQGAPPGTIAAFWVVLGAAAVASAFGWSPTLARLRGGHSPALTIGATAVGAAVLLVSASPVVAFGSAVVFGGSFLAVVAAVTTLARRVLPPAAWTPAIAALTVAFAVGQGVGPTLAGVLADGAGGMRAGLALSIALLTVGAAIALTQSEPAA